MCGVGVSFSADSSTSSAPLSHPLLQSYAETAERSFPLILAIGREPNSSLPIGNIHGSYDFDRQPNCAFWNISYALLGRSIGTTARELKNEARARRASPIVYADSLPISLENAVSDKKKHRRAIPAGLSRAHIDQIFAYRPLLDRVSIVLASGLEDDVFSESVSRIRDSCEKSGIHYAELPFFYGTHTPKIKIAVAGGLENSIRAVMSAFIGKVLPDAVDSLTEPNST